MRGIAATLAVFVSMSFCPATHAQGNISANQENRLAAHHGGGDRNPEMETNAQALASWQDAKFGLSVHWDPSALRGVEISWTRGGAGAGWVQGALSAKEYDALYKEFNPALFNAKEWVQLWKDTGVRYVTLVSKHHDGFVMWGTKQTDYNITNTPFHRDYLKELSDECREQGIKFGAYYSILDFYNYDYQVGAGSTESPNPDGPGFKLDRKPVFDRYVEYMKAELKELIQDYHVEILLFDGNWEPSWTHERGSDLYRYLHSLNPSLLISNRVDTKGSNEEARLMGYSGALWVYNPKPWNYEKYAGDYLEREVYIGGPEPYPWEAWITFTGAQWAWKPNDTYKSPEDVIRYVVVTAGNGGNLNLNVSPMLDGRFEERQKETLLKIGTWLKANGESIYGTRGGPFESGLWGSSTRKGNTLYVHVLAWPGETLRLPPLEKSVKSAKLLHGGEVHWKQTMNGLEISVSESRRDPLDTIVELTVAE